MDNDKVIPFRKRSPSDKELEVYRQITRNWDPALRQMMFPDHFKREQESDEGSR